MSLLDGDGIELGWGFHQSLLRSHQNQILRETAVHDTYFNKEAKTKMGTQDAKFPCPIVSLPQIGSPAG
jgi:hypothetical protein